MTKNDCGCREKKRESYTLVKQSAVLLGSLEKVEYNKKE